MALQIDSALRELIEAQARSTNSIVAITAFGSRAKGTATPQSDLDLAFTMDGQTPGERGAAFAHDVSHSDDWPSIGEPFGIELHLKLHDAEFAPDTARYAVGGTVIYRRQ